LFLVCEEVSDLLGSSWSESSGANPGDDGEGKESNDNTSKENEDL